MGAPKGNKNSAGKPKAGKGTGRKSVKQELLDLTFLEDLFLGKISNKVALNKIRSGKYSIKDRMVIMALDGNERIIGQIINKIFPNKQEISGPGGKPIGVKFELDEKSREKINRLIAKFGGRSS